MFRWIPIHREAIHRIRTHRENEKELLTQQRDLIHKGIRKNCRLVATMLPCPYQTVIIKYQDGKEEKTTVSYNALPVKLPGYEHPLLLVVVKGSGKCQ